MVKIHVSSVVIQNIYAVFNTSEPCIAAWKWEYMQNEHIQFSPLVFKL